MGEELALDEARAVRVAARARAFVPMERLLVLVNGKAFATVEGPSRELSWSGEIALDGSSWIAVQAEGGPSPFVTDSHLFAHSTPVWVPIGGRPVLVEEDRAYLERYVAALIELVRNESDFRNEIEREITMRGFTEARYRIRALRLR
jgi:hypothetical protein